MNNLPIEVMHSDILMTRMSSLRKEGNRCAFYARFFLHTLNNAEIRGFFENIAEAMLPGEFLFTEYRNQNDAHLTKYTEAHFERFIHRML